MVQKMKFVAGLAAFIWASMDLAQWSMSGHGLSNLRLFSPSCRRSSNHDFATIHCGLLVNLDLSSRLSRFLSLTDNDVVFSYDCKIFPYSKKFVFWLFLMYYWSKIWNKLPEDIAPSLVVFLHHLKDFLFRICYPESCHCLVITLLSEIKLCEDNLHNLTSINVNKKVIN